MAKATHYLHLEYLRNLKNMGLLTGQQVETKLPEIKFPVQPPKSKQEEEK
jgi:hypothetical protein